jgi:hypothetical protein
MKKIINYIAPALSIAALVLALMTFSITKARGAEECDVLKLDRSLKDSFFAEWFDLGCYEVEDCCYDMHTTTCNGYTRMYWVENRANHTYFPWHYVEHIAMRDWYGGLRLETREHVYHTSYAIKMVVITEMVDSDLDGSLDYFDRHVHYEDVDIYQLNILVCVDLPFYLNTNSGSCLTRKSNTGLIYTKAGLTCET